MPDGSIASVIGASARAEPNPGASLDEELKTRLDKVDLLIADLGTIEQLKSRASDYIKESQTELAWNRKIRAASAMLTLALVTALTVLFSYAILGTGYTNKAVNASTLTAIAVGCISGAVVLTIAVTRSAFASIADRNAGLPMPEHLTVLLETLKALTSK